MKIAIQLFGHIRTYKDCYEALKNHLLNKYDCDVFMHTWSTLDSLTQSWHNDHMSNKEQIIIQQERELVELYNLQGIKIDEQIYQDMGKIKTKDKEIDLFGIHCMFTSMEEADNLRVKYSKENNINYDYVICIRPDILLKDDFKIEDYIANFTKEELDRAFFTNVNKNSHTPVWNNNNSLLAVDLFFMAKPEVMTSIFKQKSKILEMYKTKNENFAASYIFLNTIEDLNYKVYITKYNLPDNFEILREKSNKEATETITRDILGILKINHTGVNKRITLFGISIYSEKEKENHKILRILFIKIKKRKR